MRKRLLLLLSFHPPVIPLSCHSGVSRNRENPRLRSFVFRDAGPFDRLQDARHDDPLGRPSSHSHRAVIPALSRDRSIPGAILCPGNGRSDAAWPEASVRSFTIGVLFDK